jgi:hypothetical protein
VLQEVIGRGSFEVRIEIGVRSGVLNRVISERLMKTLSIENTFTPCKRVYKVLNFSDTVPGKSPDFLDQFLLFHIRKYNTGPVALNAFNVGTTEQPESETRKGSNRVYKVVNYYRGVAPMTELELIKQLAGNLTPAEKEILAHYLVEANGDQPSSEKLQSLRGDWAAAFPQDFDVDAELKEIRGEWEKEWHEDEFVG